MLYTVIAGDYDAVQPVNVDNFLNIEFVIVSDRYRPVPSGWTLHVIEKKANETNIEYNRKYKILVQTLFEHYDISVYIDANISVVNDISDLVSVFNDEIKSIALYKHPVRSSIYDEAEEIKKIGYDYSFNIDRQMNRYKRDRFESNELYEANIIFRKRNKVVFDTMKLWWHEFSCGVKRDQLSLTYCCYKTGLDIKNLGLHDARFVNKYFRYNAHLKKNASRNIIARLYNYVSRRIF